MCTVAQLRRIGRWFLGVEDRAPWQAKLAVCLTVIFVAFSAVFIIFSFVLASIRYSYFISSTEIESKLPYDELDQVPYYLTMP